MSDKELDRFFDLQRIQALTERNILDTPSDRALDALTAVAAKYFNAPMSLVSLLDEHRQWFKSRQGLDVCETARDIAFCDYAIRDTEPLIVLDATKDTRFAKNPLVTSDPHIRFYAGYPLITADGYALGTFCIIGLEPRKSFDQSDIALLKSLCEQATEIIEANYPRLSTQTTSATSPESNGDKILSAGSLLNAIIQKMPMAVALVDQSLKYVSANSEWYRLYRIQKPNVIGESHLKYIGPASDQRQATLIENAKNGTQEEGLELCLQLDEENTWFKAHSYPWYHDDGSYGGLILFRLPIDDTVQARQTALNSEERYRRIYEKTPAMMYSIDAAGRIWRVSEYFLSATGYQSEDVIGTDPVSFMDDESSNLISNAIRSALKSLGTISEVPVTYICKDGSRIQTLVSATTEYDEDGTFQYGHAVIFDISEKERLQAKIEDHENSYKSIYDQSPIMLYSTQKNGRIARMSKYCLTQLGYQEEDVIGTQFWNFISKTDATKMHTLAAAGVLDSGSVSNMPVTFIKKNGKQLEALLSSVATYDSRGNFVESLCVLTDITQVKILEKEAVERDRLISSFMDHSPTSMFSKTPDGEYILMNTAFREGNGIAKDAHRVTTRSLFDEELTATLTEMDRKVIHDKVVVKDVLDVPNAAGKIRKMVVSKFPILDDKNDIVAIGGVTLDVTERQNAEEALRQTQKMDAVGNLTGGIAHDFNNLLAIIMGNLQLLERMLKDEPKALKRLNSALVASKRGADLTAQLLAFSRRQELKPMVIDVNDAVRSLYSMIQWTITDSIDIKFSLGDFESKTHIDESQLQTALLNLAINARDAMPAGGQLLIKTEQVDIQAPSLAELDGILDGTYIVISLTDTGHGMNDDVKERVFEPFFTTKDTGKGTGLGLAMVYGFIKQSKGHVSIYSEIDHGTTIRLYLPIFEGENTVDEEVDVIISDQPETGRILIVEDDDGVRMIVQSMIEDLGYDTVSVDSAASALSVLETDQEYDLVFSDIVMPGGMTGVDLTKQIEKLKYPVPVLLTSGYPRDALRFESGMHVLQKPYQQETLAKEIELAIKTVKG